MARIFKTKQSQASFVASTQGRIQLSRNYHTQQLLCKLVVNHNNASANFKSEHFANLINAIQIVANGDKTIKHVDVKKLVYNALYHNGKAMHNSIVTADGANKVSTIYFTVDFSMRGMAKPSDTIENSSLYNTFDMMIDWGSDSKVGTGVIINSATLTVSSSQLVNYSRNPGERIAHNIETQLSEDITSTTTEHQINLPIKKVYRRFLIAGLVDNVRNNALIKGVKVKSGTTVFMEWDADDLRAFNIDKHNIRTETDADGLLLIDFSERGRVSDALDTRGQFNTLELVLDVEKQAGTNKVIIYSDVFDVEPTVEVKG